MSSEWIRCFVLFTNRAVSTFNLYPNFCSVFDDWITMRDFTTYRHMSARACWRWICVRCVANWKLITIDQLVRFVNRLTNLSNEKKARTLHTCWWCASVCFISTIRILCSMAYFFALATKSCWSDVNFGNAPPNIPSKGEREPGPNSTSPNCRRSFNGVVIKGIFGCQSECWRKRKNREKKHMIRHKQIDRCSADTSQQSRWGALTIFYRTLTIDFLFQNISIDLNWPLVPPVHSSNLVVDEIVDAPGLCHLIAFIVRLVNNLELEFICNLYRRFNGRPREPYRMRYAFSFSQFSHNINHSRFWLLQARQLHTHTHQLNGGGSSWTMRVCVWVCVRRRWPRRAFFFR